MKPLISIIVATDERRAIGKNGKLLWHLPGDLKYFKSVTNGHTVIMGRKTFDSLPNGALPGRKNIVISRNPDLRYENCMICGTVEEALAACDGEQEIFILGGESIYRQTLPLADKLYLTLVHAQFPDADHYFPAITASEWEETGRTKCPADEKNPYSHSFLTYIRKK
ncbi:MAG: dihydrofolate reductase [Tannerella sp.]|nr:dihydrofolate reductase [Tannerella sp.]